MQLQDRSLLLDNSFKNLLDHVLNQSTHINPIKTWFTKKLLMMEWMMMTKTRR